MHQSAMIRCLCLCNFVYFCIITLMNLGIFNAITSIIFFNMILVFFLQLKSSKSDHHNNNNNRTKILVFFDWDDTLYPTTNMNYDDPIYPKYRDTLQKLLGDAAKWLGPDQLFIVSNADLGWITQCQEQMGLRSFFESSGITVKSAKNQYADVFPKQPIVWKKRMFSRIIAANLHYIFDDQCIVIICIGDSVCEYRAIQEAVEDFNKHLPDIANPNGEYHKPILLYRMKLTESPTMEQLWKELLFIYKLLGDVCIG